METSDLQKLISVPKTLIIDVRSQKEFQSAHFINSINIPIDQFENQIEEWVKNYHFFILVCHSGIRSERALEICISKGINAVNLGSWQKINFIYE